MTSIPVYLISGLLKIQIVPYIQTFLPLTFPGRLNPAFLAGLAGSKVNGRNYAFPTNKELAATRGLMIRKGIADQKAPRLRGREARGFSFGGAADRSSAVGAA